MKSKKIMAAVLTALIVLTGCGGNTVHPPYEKTECIGMNYEQVEADFKEAGFETVTVEETETTSSEKDGTVRGIAIDGDNYEAFTENSTYRPSDTVEITYYVLNEFTPEIGVEVEGQDGKPKFTIKTNLPDKTKLVLTLVDGDKYTGQQTITVKGGEAVSKAFEQDKGYPVAGECTLTVTMVMDDQKSGVKKKLGENGDCLVGEIVETDGDGRKYVFYETQYTSPYGVEELEGYISEIENKENYEMALELVKQRLEEEFEGNCTMESDSSGIVINMWKDGLALTASCALLGEQSCIDAWNGGVEATRQLSESIQKEILDVYGYKNRSVTINVLNDIDQIRTLLTVTSGEVVYDCVKDGE